MKTLAVTMTMPLRKNISMSPFSSPTTFSYTEPCRYQSTRSSALVTVNERRGAVPK